MIHPPHPGETIREDYLVPLGMSVSQLAQALGVGRAKLNEIVRGRHGVTGDTALRLNLQSLFDLRIAELQLRSMIG